MKQIKIRWDINDRVMIKELKTIGGVISIWIVSRGTQYEVRYFYNGDAKSIYFFENELEDAKQ